MANKLSINDVHADQPLAQVKTGEIFTVQMVDLANKKVTISNEAGEEKVVSKATLERWYRELTSDEIQKWNESFSAEENANGEDAGEENSGNEDDGTADETGAETAHSGNDAGEGDADDSGEDTEGTSEGAEEIEGNDGQVGEDNSGESNSSSKDGVKSPVTPSNAGKDKDKSKEGKKSESNKANAALMKVRQTIIDTILADSESIQLKKTSGYDVLKEKHNFAEITRGTNRFNVSVMSKCLTEDQINKVKINPASFGWSIDADFTVFDEGDIEMAVQLIRQSREYRLAHPVTRKKKEKATEKAEGKGKK